MKSLIQSFIDARALPMPPATTKTITLTEFMLDGTFVNDHDLTSDLKGGLPIIDKEVEIEMNDFITGEITLKFHDPDKLIDDIINQSNRKFGLKVEINLEGLDPLPPLWVVGGDAANDMGYANDPTDYSDWTTIAGVITGHVYAVESNRDPVNPMWVAGGDGGNTLAYSTDGINWTGLGTSIFSTRCYSIAYYNGRWIAGGEGGNIFAWTDDPTSVGNWTAFDNNLFKSTRSLACNGTRWVAGGEGAGHSHTLAYSDDNGESWTGLGKSIFANSCGSLEWNDDDGFFLGGGYYGTHTLAKSTNGTSWAGKSKPLGFNDIAGLKWNGSLWVAVGSAPSHTIMYSSDGDSWTGCGTSSLGYGGDGVDYSNGVWVAVGNATNHSMTTSTNGTSWTPLTPDLFEPGLLHCVGVMPEYEQPDLVLFDGMIDISQCRRFGRNTLTLTAQTWEKELEHHNAELVVDTENIPFRNICGVYIDGVSGGQPGLKTMKYTFNETEDDKLYKLQYEDGPPKIFEEGDNQAFSLFNQIGDQEITGYFSSSKALEVDAEDNFIIGADMTINDIGYWHQAVDIPTLIGKLFDRSTIEIITRLIDVNEEVGTLASSEFMYFHKTYFGDSADLHGSEAYARSENRTVSHGKVFVARTEVYNYEWNKNTLEFTKTKKFDCTDYLSGTLFVEKILYDESGNKFLVCVGWVDYTKANEDKLYDCCCGVIKTDVNGNYVTHWTDSDLTGGSVVWYWTGHTHRYVLARTFHWCVRNTTPFCNRDYLAFITMTEKFGANGYAGGIAGYAFDVTTGSMVDFLADEPGSYTSDFGQGAIVVWDQSSSQVGLVYGVWFNYTDNKVYAIQIDNSGIYSQEKTHLDVDDDMGGQFQYNYTDSGFYTRFCIYSNPKDIEGERQIFLVWENFQRFPEETINRIFACAYIETKYPITILSYYPMKAYGWSLDDDNNQEGIVQVSIPAYELPEIEVKVTGFEGRYYRVAGYPYKYSDVWMGIAVAGYSTTLIAFAVTNVSKNYIMIADFSDMNVREAINEIACLMCYWKRPERDKALFYSRGNYNGTFTLDNNLYKSNYIESKTRPYIGVEVTNPLDEKYKYRYPDTFNSEEGEVFKLSNRFIYSLNGYVTAQLLADWLLQIRTEAEVEGFFLIELEELDKVEWKKYHGDGSPDEQVDCVLMKASYDDKSKLVTLKMVRLQGYSFKTVTFKPNYFSGS